MRGLKRNLLEYEVGRARLFVNALLHSKKDNIRAGGEHTLLVCCFVHIDERMLANWMDYCKCSHHQKMSGSQHSGRDLYREKPNHMMMHTGWLLRHDGPIPLLYSARSTRDLFFHLSCIHQESIFQKCVLPVRRVGGLRANECVLYEYMNDFC